MASIKSQLVLRDGMTPALRNITKALNMTLSSFEAVQRASGRAVNTASINAARAELGRANTALDQVEQNLRDCGNEQDKFNKKLSTGTSNASGLMSKIKGIAATYLGMQAVKGVVNLSDELVSSEARLKLLVDDEGSVKALQEQIYASAQSARASYTDTMATVAKLGLVAGKAFEDATGNVKTNELIMFTELLSKNFVVGGASAQEQAAAMYQLTQAMGSGRLQGDEYRSIIENAPLLAKSIEDYMRNVKGAQGSMKEWASEGLLTADVIKAAVFQSATEVEQRFNEMPMTWSQIWTGMKNQAVVALDPLLVKISELARSPEVQTFIQGLMSGFAAITVVAAELFNVIAKIGSFMITNWSRIGPIVYGIAAAFVAYNAALLVHKAILAAQLVIEKIQAIQAYAKAKGILSQAAAHGINTKAVIAEATAHGVNAAALTGEAAAAGLAAAGLTAEQVATAGATVAQTGFNTALWACPLTWIIALVIVLIVLVAIFFEYVTGALWWLGALFKNIGLWIANVGIAIWNTIKNVGLWFANLGLSIWTVIKNIGLWFANLGLAIWAVIKNVGLFFANLGMGVWEVMKACASNIATAFKNGWINIQIGFWSMVDAIMQGLKAVAEKANKYLGWMGVDIDTSGLDFASKKIDELNSKKDEYKDIGEAWADGFSTFQYESVGDAFGTYDYGSVSDAWNTNDIDWAGGWNDGMSTFDTFQSGWGSEAFNNGKEVGLGVKSALGDMLSFDSITDEFGLNGEDYSSVLDDISGDTGSIAGATKNSDEDLAYLRDLAEMEAINRFTTAEVKIDMTGMTNKIDSNMDLDGVLTVLTDGFAEALEIAAEGVHS